MPVCLYSSNGHPREYLFQSDPESRARIERTATNGDILAICQCPMPHFGGGGFVLSVHFRAHGIETDEGPAFAV